jgi:type I restriction enzyme M protein
LAAIRPNKKIEPMYLFNYLKAIEANIYGNGGSVFDSISNGQIRKIKIPLPPIESQKKLTEQFEKEQKIINANKELITIFENKIKDKIAEVWGE